MSTEARQIDSNKKQTKHVQFNQIRIIYEKSRAISKGYSKLILRDADKVIAK